MHLELYWIHLYEDEHIAEFILCWLFCCLSLLFSCCLWLGLYYTVFGYIHPTYAAIFFFEVFLGLGDGFCDNSAMWASQRNFPGQQGSASALSKVRLYTWLSLPLAAHFIFLIFHEAWSCHAPSFISVLERKGEEIRQHFFFLCFSPLLLFCCCCSFFFFFFSSLLCVRLGMESPPLSSIWRSWSQCWIRMA